MRAGDLFVARGGTKVSGAAYAVDAVQRGAVAVVAEEEIAGLGKAAFARVADANLAAALLAHAVAGCPTRGMKMVGVTGTKGKTTVAYLLRSVLKAAGHRVGMIGTVEIDDGAKVTPAEMTTPSAVELVEMFCRMRANGVTHCVMEVSSHALDQRRVAGIDFDVAIFTNLTGDHLDYHGTMEEYAAAKALLFEGLKEGAVAVVNVDDKWAGRMVEGCKARVVPCHIEMGIGKTGLETAKRPDKGWSGLITYMASDGMWMNLAGPEPLRDGNRQMYKMATPLVGRHNAYNTICVVAAAHSLGLPDSEFMHGIRAIPNANGAPGRLQAVVPAGMKREAIPFSVFVDYAHTHDALENVLTALRATMREGSGASPVSGALSGHSRRVADGRGIVHAVGHGTPRTGGHRRDADATGGAIDLRVWVRWGSGSDEAAEDGSGGGAVGGCGDRDERQSADGGAGGDY